MKRITLTAELIEEEEGGYTVYCPELDIYTQGDDIEEAIHNFKEAAELHIEELGIENGRYSCGAVTGTAEGVIQKEEKLNI